MQPTRKLRLRQRAQINDRICIGQAADDKQNSRDDGEHGESFDRRVIKPVPARAFFQNVLQTAEADGHQSDAEIIRVFQQREIRLVNFHQHRRQHGDQRAGQKVDVKKPAPVQRVGDPAADDRAERRRDGGDRADDCRGINTARSLEIMERRREHRRNHRSAQQSLQRAENDHAFDVPRRCRTTGSPA